MAANFCNSILPNLTECIHHMIPPRAQDDRQLFRGVHTLHISASLPPLRLCQLVKLLHIWEISHRKSCLQNLNIWWIFVKILKCLLKNSLAQRSLSFDFKLVGFQCQRKCLSPMNKMLTIYLNDWAKYPFLGPGGCHRGPI